MWSSHDSVSWTKIDFACRPFFHLQKVQGIRQQIEAPDWFLQISIVN